MVPFLYLVYRGTPSSLSAQTLVAHATSLAVAWVASSVGTWRYTRARAIAWAPALLYALPGIATAFLTARLLTRVHQLDWVRALFGVFLLISSADMIRRSHRPHDPAVPRAPHSWIWLLGAGAAGGGVASLLGIGGGLIAVPVFLYLGRLPIRAVAPTALAGVCLTTMAGGIGYLTAGPGPAVSDWTVGFVDLRMTAPLSLGAMVTVPLGVRINRNAPAATLFRIFAGLLAGIGLTVLWGWYRGS